MLYVTVNSKTAATSAAAFEPPDAYYKYVVNIFVFHTYVWLSGIAVRHWTCDQ